MKMPQVGEVVAGRYRIERQLGRGGMGVVFEATHTGLERACAIKFLAAKLSHDEEYRERFMREAKVNARLAHPNVVHIFDTGVHEGLLYIAMELLHGEPLSKFLDDERLGELPARLQVAEQIADALDAAHRIGLIHRDLKPANVQVETDPESGARRCVLLDFGLAFIQGDESGLDRITQENGNVAGTPLYMSPEQISSAPLTPATDIYSFGCMLYEMITGETPFEGGEDATVIRIMTRHMFKAPEPMRRLVPDVPMPLEELVRTMLQKDPALRPEARRVGQMLREIEHLPQTGRGGTVRARHERQVQGPTQRDDGLETTARLHAKGSARPSAMHRVGLWRLKVSEDHDTALAMAGFSVQKLTSLEELAQVELVLVGPASMEEIEVLAAQRPIVMLVKPEHLSQATALLRAGVSDVLSIEAGIDEFGKRIERVHKRVMRQQRRGG